MAEKNSTLVRSSRYVSGGETEVNTTALEWWERAVFPLNSDDQIYVVEKRFVGRLDQIAAMFVTEPRYWWVIAQYNNILDPYSDVVEGLVLRIPTADRIKGMLTGQLGGAASTRTVPLSIFPIV
jgi:hypothetical protein